MMESISMLLFKEGFTVQPLPDGQSPQYYGIDENLIWRNGISIPAAVNHNGISLDHATPEHKEDRLSVLEAAPLYDC